MPDTDSPEFGATPWDLCIIGAGIAGLNALFVACEHLPSMARVLLVDRNDRCGGMWTKTYPYVHLHQPHPMFTVGDIPWNWTKPAHYLAKGTEVAAHLSACLDQMRSKLHLTEAYGQTCDGIYEGVEKGESFAEVQLRAVDGGSQQIVRAKRLIDARGLDIPEIIPLALSSEHVTSTTPHALDIAGTAPVYVIGGGKTGMDTAHALVKNAPSRSVTMLTGKGTIFANRDFTLPTGMARYWRGKLVVPTFRELAMRFDGTNHDAVFAHYRDTYTISPSGTGEQFLFGILSEAESQTIANGVDGFIGDYLTDVRDTDTGPEMILRSGARHAVPAGSVFVNCTGHLLRQERPYTPFLSPGGAILTITSRSAAYFLSSVAGYFLPHLFLTGKLRDAGLYEIDFDALRQIDRKLMHIVGVTHTFLNTIIIMDALPFRVLDRCGLDLDRWFPLHRRLAALIDVKLNRRRYLDHTRRSLDRVREEHGIACGPPPAA